MSQFLKLVRIWKSHQCYSPSSQTPAWLLIMQGGLSSLIAYYYVYLLNKFAPVFFETADQAGYLGVKGTIFAIILLLLALSTWGFSSIALRCSTILHERIFR